MIAGMVSWKSIIRPFTLTSFGTTEITTETQRHREPGSGYYCHSERSEESASTANCLAISALEAPLNGLLVTRTDVREWSRFFAALRMTRMAFPLFSASLYLYGDGTFPHH